MRDPRSLDALTLESRARVGSLVTHTMADGRTPLHFARSIETAVVLLDAGADIDDEDVGGLTPLEWIGATGRDKAVAASLRSRGATARSLDTRR